MIGILSRLAQRTEEHSLSQAKCYKHKDISSKSLKHIWTCTHINYNIEGVVIGQKDTNTATVLHGFVVVEVQFVHLCVAATGQASLPANGALGPPMTSKTTTTRPLLVQLQSFIDRLVRGGSAGLEALTGRSMGTPAAELQGHNTGETVIVLGMNKKTFNSEFYWQCSQ